MKRYLSLLQKRPYLINATTGFGIAVVGDVACQYYIESAKELDIGRSADMGLIRAFLITPFIQFYYPLLRSLSPQRTVMGVAKMVLIDQLIGSPTVIALVFAGTCALGTGSTGIPSCCGGGSRSSDTDKLTFPTSLVKKIEEDLPACWKKGLQYWPWVHVITFGLVPLLHQPLWASFASIYWMGLLSYHAHRSDSRHKLETKTNDSINAETAVRSKGSKGSKVVIAH